MDKTHKRSLFRKNLSLFLQRNWLYLLLGVMYLCGIVLGTFSLKLCDENLLNSLASILTGSMAEREKYTFVQLTLSSFISNITFLIILFFLGFCTIAQPVILLIPLFKGLGYGALGGYLLASEGFKTYGYLLSVVVPGMFLFSLLTLFASGSAFRMSAALRAAARGKDTEFLTSRQYLVKFLYFVIINYGISLLDALICTTFIRYF